LNSDRLPALTFDLVLSPGLAATSIAGLVSAGRCAVWLTADEVRGRCKLAGDAWAYRRAKTMLQCDWAQKKPG
jgi:hypothetical protein